MANEDLLYLSWLCRQPCSAPGEPHPGGDPHHATHLENGGGVGMGMRGHDHRAIPLCRKCHMDLHALKGPFRGWQKQQVRDWVDARIVDSRAKYERSGEAVASEPRAPVARRLCGVCVGRGYVTNNVLRAISCEACSGSGEFVSDTAESCADGVVIPSGEKGT